MKETIFGFTFYVPALRKQMRGIKMWQWTRSETAKGSIKEHGKSEWQMNFEGEFSAVMR